MDPITATPQAPSAGGPAATPNSGAPAVANEPAFLSDTSTAQPQAGTPPATNEQTPEQKAAAEAQAAADANLTPEQKAAKEAEQKAADDAKKAGAPEQYEAFKTPDDVQLDPEVTGEFQGVAKEMNLPQDKAQRLVDLGTKLAQRWQTKQADAVQSLQATWKAESLVDQEFGGDKLKENLAIAEKGLDAVGTPELRQLLKESGLGLHKEIIRAFYRVGKEMSGDGMVRGGEPKAQPQDLESRATQQLYGAK